MILTLFPPAGFGYVSICAVKSIADTIPSPSCPVSTASMSCHLLLQQKAARLISHLYLPLWTEAKQSGRSKSSMDGGGEDAVDAVDTCLLMDDVLEWVAVDEEDLVQAVQKGVLGYGIPVGPTFQLFHRRISEGSGKAGGGVGVWRGV